MIELVDDSAPGATMTSDYVRVYEAISDLIARRAEGYQSGDRLPSIVKLAAEYDTGQTTIKRALDLLRRDGWTRGHQGKGTFVAEQPPNR